MKADGGNKTESALWLGMCSKSVSSLTAPSESTAVLSTRHVFYISCKIYTDEEGETTNTQC